MLVFTRKIRQGATIETPEGRRIHIQVVRTQGGRVRLAVTADRAVAIARDELCIHGRPPQAVAVEVSA